MSTLWLIPCPIAEEAESTVPEAVRQALVPLRYFLAEDVRTARRVLSRLRIFSSIEELHFEVLDKKTTDAEVAQRLAPLLQGHDVGILSEAGCPGVADPGSKAVAFAHARGVRVRPLVGPSSLLLALMASGLNGQRFAFQGYLPIAKAEALAAIRQLETESRLKQQTQLVIETPYRNGACFRNLLQALHPDTWLHVSYDLTGPREFTRTRQVCDWREDQRPGDKRPAVFAFLANVTR